MAKFYGTGPGQRLQEVVHRFDSDNLHTVLGPDVVALLTAITDPSERIPTLRRAAVQALRDQANDLMRQRHIRNICLDATSLEKLRELAGRLEVSHVDDLRTLQFDHDIQNWRAFLEFYGVDTFDTPSSAPPQEQERITPKFGLFPHQRRVANQAYDIIRDGHGRLLVHMPTGTGKTRTAMHIVSRVLANAEPCVVVWLAATVELLDQAAEAFQTAWTRLGNRDIRLTRFWGSHSPSLSHISDGIVVAGLQKMRALNARRPVDVLRLGAESRLVVVDEAHQSIATTYRTVVSALTETGPSTALLGLTATPGRTWSDINADAHLSAFFRGRKVTVEVDGYKDPVSGLVNQGYMARPTFSRLEIDSPPNLPHDPSGADNDESLLDALATHLDRNVMIIGEIRRLIQTGHTRIMLFGASVRHAKHTALALTAIDIVANLVTATTSPNARRRIINAFRKPSPTPMVLCNYGVLTAGFDAPTTSACLIARPTRSLVLFSQMVGRATRGPLAGGNTTCAVSTVVDLNLPGFRDLTEAFTNWEDVWNDARR